MLSLDQVRHEQMVECSPRDGLAEVEGLMTHEAQQLGGGRPEGRLLPFVHVEIRVDASSRWQIGHVGGGPRSRR